MKVKLVIADGEEDYVNGITAFVLNQAEIPIDVFGFSDKGIFLEYMKAHQSDILLVCEDFLDEEVLGKLTNIIVLSKGNVQKENLEYSYLFKYSRLQDIWKRILNVISESDILISKKSWNYTKIIGISSPVGQAGKTTIAIALAQELAKEAKVLLINLEKYSTLEKLLGVEADSDLGELLLYGKQRYSNLALKLQMIKKNTSNYDFLPTVIHNEDLIETVIEDWQYIINQIIEKLEYQYILVDLGENSHLLKLCNKIITPISLSATSIIKFQKWSKENSDLEITTVVTCYKEGSSMPPELAGCVKIPFIQMSINNTVYPVELQDLVRRCKG